MGSTFSDSMTFQEAASRLGKCLRQVRNYVDKGLIQTEKKRGHVRLCRSDVEQIAEHGAVKLRSLSARAVVELSARVQRLEEQMHAVEQIWKHQGLVSKALRPSQQDAQYYWQLVTEMLSSDRKAYAFKELETWSELFASFDEESLEPFCTVARTAKPWEPFFLLCTRMKEAVAAQKRFKESIDLQALHTKLELGRKKLREAALMWIEMGRGSVPKSLLTEMDSHGEALMRRLSEEKASPRASHLRAAEI